MQDKLLKALLMVSDTCFDKKRERKRIEFILRTKRHTSKLPSFITSSEFCLDSFKCFASDLFNRWPGLNEEDRLLFDTYLKQNKKIENNSCLIVTSLSPNPKNTERQQECLDSWKHLGFKVLCVSASHENPCIHTDYLIKTDNLCDSVAGCKPTVKISEMIKIGASFDTDLLLINSDIEIIDPNNLLSFNDNEFTAGIRWNYKHNKILSKKEGCGIDAFFIPQSMAKKVEDAPYGIGRPTWDYWMVSKAKQLGYKVNLLDCPLFFHKKHDLNWSDKSWKYFTTKYLNEFGGNWKHLADVCRIRANLFNDI